MSLNKQVFVNRIYFVLAGLAALVCSIYLLALPASPQNAWLFGYSKIRLMAVGFLITACIISGILTFICIKYTKIDHLVAKLLDRRFLRWLLLLFSVAALFPGIAATFLASSIMGGLDNTFIRLQPVILWFTIVSGEMVIFLLLSSKQLFVEDLRQMTFADWIVVLSGFAFLGWSIIFIYLSSFPVIDGRRYFCLFDDAMISMRYAWNLSHGFGLVWNSGERVEGYTNLLMTLLMSVSTLLFNKNIAVLSVQILGIIFMFSNAILSVLIFNLAFCRHFYPCRLAGSLLFFQALFYYPAAYWSLMGMETGLLTTLLFLAVYFTFRWKRRRQDRHLVLIALILGLACLTRPDAILFSIPVVTFVLYINRNSPSEAVRKVALVALFLFFPIGQTIFRWFYYHELVPNTYTLKVSGLPMLIRLQNGVGYILPFLKLMLILEILALSSLVIKFQKHKLFLFSFFVLMVLYQIWVGGDAWFYWRLLTPTVPFLMMIMTQQIIDGIERIKSLYRDTLLGKYQYTTPVFSLSLVVLSLIVVNYRFLPEMVFKARPYTSPSNQMNTNMALALNQVVTNEATVGVFWAGSVPYYTGLYAVDFLGKSDKYIAQLPQYIPEPELVTWKELFIYPGHNKCDLDYSIKQLKPTYIQGSQCVWHDISEWVDQHYVRVDYRGRTLTLLKNSPDVNWDKLVTE